MSEQKTSVEIYDPMTSPSLRSWGDRDEELTKSNVAVECGWGRLLFGHTFKNNESIAEVLKEEKNGARDMALYLRDPHVVVASAPQELFIDPSYTFRLPLEVYEPLKKHKGGFYIRLLEPEKDISSINRIYQSRDMVTIDDAFLLEVYKGRFIKYWVAVDEESDAVIAVCMGIDHNIAFDDPENGSSLWCLAVDPQATHPGIGLQLVQHIAGFYQEEGRSFMDLSVLHSNDQAISLYKKLGFVQVPVFCVKNKNAINEKLFVGPEVEEALNPYSMVIINEARRRGIRVDVLDAMDDYYSLSFGGKSVVCRESLSDVTSSIAMARCIDKATTIRLLENDGLSVPSHIDEESPAQNNAFLALHESLVVKPAIGEHGAGISLNVRTKHELKEAVKLARTVSQKVILEERVEGQDLRIIVIGYAVVAAALRKPPVVMGNGQHTILELIKKQSRRRAQATQGMSQIPLDDDLDDMINDAGYTLDDILPMGEELQVRQASNLRMGGTFHDVTDILHPKLAKAAIRAAHAIGIPVVGIDFKVSAPDQPDYVIIGANERPGLANHEPQPTAERFIDFLFPQTVGR